MKKQVLLLCLTVLLLTVLTFGMAYADHKKSGYIDKEPKDALTSLTPAQAEARDKLKADIVKLYDEYTDKVLKYAEKKMQEPGYATGCDEKTGKCTGTMMLKEVLMDAQEKYSHDYFGDWDKYDDGDVGELAKKLFDEYGEVLHFGREQEVTGYFMGVPIYLEDFWCQPNNSHQWDKANCEGAVKIANFKNLSWNNKTKKIEQSGEGLWEITFNRAKGMGADAGASVFTIASHGMFTPDQVKYFGECSIQDAKKKAESQVSKPKVVTEETIDSVNEDTSAKLPFNYKDIKDKVGQEMRATFQGLTNDMQSNLFAADCDKEGLSIVSQFLNISRPLNLTDNQYIMKLVHITQQLAFTLTIVFIAFYALMYTTGFQNIDPIKFSIRLFVALLIVNYLPWLMQDILNLNNIIVYNLSLINFSSGVGGNAGDILMGSFLALFDGFAGAGIGESMLLLLLGILMAFIAIVPLLRVIMWWYIRLLRIFLGAIVGPIMIMMLSLPQTADKAMNWIKMYIGTVFEQVFMILGLILVATIVGNIGDMGEQMGLGWFGRAVLIYASIYFLADVPEFANSFLNTFSGGSATSYASRLQGDAKKSYSRTKNAAKGTAKVGAGATLGAVGLAAGAKAGFTGKQSNGKLMQAVMKSKVGKAAFGAGNLTGKVGAQGVQKAGQGVQSAKQKAANFHSGATSGNAGQGMLSGAGLSGKAGSVVGALNRKAQKANNVISQTAQKAKKKMGDAKVSMQMGAALAGATIMNNMKKENLKKKMSGAMDSVMTGIYKEAMGTDSKGRTQQVATLKNNSLGDASKIANNQGTKGGANYGAKKGKKGPKK